MATEKAPYTTEMAMEVLPRPRSSGRKVTPTARYAPETAPITTREAMSTEKVGAMAATTLPRQNTTA